MKEVKHPTKAQVQVVIDTLKEANKIAENKAPVDMMQGYVDKDHPCGTPMCHAGWYALVGAKDNLGFMVGAIKMSNDLGFKDSDHLKHWAQNNPEIWGNKNGYHMFMDGVAFGKSSDTGFTLKTIINHWKQVQSRLPL